MECVQQPHGYFHQAQSNTIRNKQWRYAVFVVVMYDRSSDFAQVDECRLDLFARKQRMFDSIPPTSTSLLQHVKRSVYQAGWVWGQAERAQQDLPSPSDWGWKLSNDQWDILWTTLEPLSASCRELIKCGCKTGCNTGRCKCNKNSLACSALCSCVCDK